MITIENEIFTLKFNAKGAELKSVFDKRFQKNIVHDGLGSYWNRSAPVLFPFVGKLKKNYYHFKDKTYQMPQHGFARDMLFELIEQSKNQVIFQLKSNKETKAYYPFNFCLRIIYTLENARVTTTYQVQNNSKKELLFSIGGHPGFVCPMYEDEKFEDYYLEFVAPETTILNHFLLEGGLLNGKMEKLILEGNTLHLSYPLFENDALVLKYLESIKIHLKSRKSSYCLTFRFRDYPFFGIWTKPNAPFICLEPWCGIADSIDSSGNLIEKEGINSLVPGALFERSYSFDVSI